MDYDTHFNSASFFHRKEKDANIRRKKNKRMYVKRLKLLASYSDLYGAYYKEHLTDTTYKGRYVRAYRSKRSKYIKNQCNRKLRNSARLNNTLFKRGNYRKATEFWYEYD